MGASLDAIDHVERVLSIEMNSVTDNPLVFAQSKSNGSSATRDIVSGGNFHGQPVALVLDCKLIT